VDLATGASGKERETGCDENESSTSHEIPPSTTPRPISRSETGATGFLGAAEGRKALAAGEPWWQIQ
jgi:hypothetical protein